MFAFPSATALEAIASIALTTMSTVVSVVALVVSYRQNAGLRPVLLVASSKLQGVGGSSAFKLVVGVEFWNRRKYPLVVRRLNSTVSGPTLDEQFSGRSTDGLHVQRNKLYLNVDQIVEPGGHLRMDLDPSFRDQSLDALRALFAVSVEYFDPYSNKSEVMRFSHKFFYPELGWKKSPRELAAARSAYQSNKREAATAP